MLQHHCSSMSSNGWGAANPLLRGSADCPLRELCRNSSLVRILARAIFTISSGGSTPVPSTVKRNSSCSHQGEPLGQCSDLIDPNRLAAAVARMHGNIEQHWLLVRSKHGMSSEPVVRPCCSCCMVSRTAGQSQPVRGTALALLPKQQPAAQGDHDAAKAAIYAANQLLKWAVRSCFWRLQITRQPKRMLNSQAGRAASQLKTKRMPACLCHSSGAVCCAELALAGADEPQRLLDQCPDESADSILADTAM